MSGLGLATVLQMDGALARPKPNLTEEIDDLAPKQPSSAGRARAMISIFCGGGPSHMDLFEDKPLLREYAGRAYPRDNLKFDNAGQATTIVMPSKWEFERCGERGVPLNRQLLPGLAEIADDVTFIHSMTLPGIRNHVAGMRAMTTGRGPEGWPSLGCWLAYGLGAESRDLPAFVALIVNKKPPGSPFWDSRQLPSIYQGTLVREQSPRIANLAPAPHLAGEPQRHQLDLLRDLNRSHLDRYPGEDDLAARMASYELAARMQTSATDALEIARESEATRKLYGLDDPVTKQMGEACLLARRLVERGVRFVQIWDYGWDMHQSIFAALESTCAKRDRPAAALVKDLKSRGLLDTTLVHWGGEMGRLPVVQERGSGLEPGRDHNTDGFTIWLAGGGIKAGHSHGTTDEFGVFAEENPLTQHDFHATLLHLFGLEADGLFVEENGSPVHLVEPGQGKVIREILV